jgi:hypothetical protein
MSFFWGVIGMIELKLVAGVIGSELLARLDVRLAISSQLRSEALEGSVVSVVVDHLDHFGSELAYPSLRIAPIMARAALVVPFGEIGQTGSVITSCRPAITYHAVSVNNRSSNVYSINNDVFRNTVRVHQIEGGICTNARHLSVSGAIGATCGIQQGVHLSYGFLFKSKLDVVCS